mmetsp:Transcript_14149/g.28154  ORF Transcript_14149/g.28154 Transcript_14149/m.28154 type:complete len:213 (-) Transcript_14149:231-869(-)
MVGWGRLLPILVLLRFVFGPVPRAHERKTFGVTKRVIPLAANPVRSRRSVAGVDDNAMLVVLPIIRLSLGKVSEVQRGAIYPREFSFMTDVGQSNPCRFLPELCHHELNHGIRVGGRNRGKIHVYILALCAGIEKTVCRGVVQLKAFCRPSHRSPSAVLAVKIAGAYETQALSVTRFVLPISWFVPVPHHDTSSSAAVTIRLPSLPICETQH